MNLLSHPVAR